MDAHGRLTDEPGRGKWPYVELLSPPPRSQSHDDL